MGQGSATVTVFGPAEGVRLSSMPSGVFYGFMALMGYRDFGALSAVTSGLETFSHP